MTMSKYRETKFAVLGLLILFVMLTAVQPAAAVPVDLELTLLSDVSGSVNDEDFNLQRGGYAAAFGDPTIQAAIENGNGIAVQLVYWSNSAAVAVPWTLIDSAAAADAFATLIADAPRPNDIGTQTGLAVAMNFGRASFADNGFEAARLVMDVSGDGADSVDGSFGDPICESCQTARANALNVDGVDTINALWIDDRDFFGDDPEDTIDALEYGLTNVIGGVGAFQSIAQDFDDFTVEIALKIGREITNPNPNPIPEPSTFTLAACGLLSVGMIGRRRRRR